MRVDVLVFDGVDDLDVTGPFETLSMARRAGADVSVRLVAEDERTAVTTAGGLRLGPVSPWSPVVADVVLVPGGGLASSQRPGVAVELGRGQIPAALREAVRPGLVLASVCTGAFLLAAAGVLGGRKATTHHMTMKALAEAGAEPVDARVVDDGDVVTAGGVTAGLDLGLWLLERFHGPEIAARVARGLEYERQGAVWLAGSVA
ncbi:DJ-1/PfpI family protein [Paractinoplanes ferrugineus]|uniref:AraC family transcriptional regulator n=1 Tax=Paractinoplanes ferrugineus TaxID=113564 RepID=A0A919JB44_9ACTN|nr:DJ-1/PfpI family protein [Actinoplanes ferrugineus]GIE16617.1 AraC family transcriptional regulator [Actinoplanes ferrugineus]